jgi:hypothetical protein
MIPKWISAPRRLLCASRAASKYSPIDTSGHLSVAISCHPSSDSTDLAFSGRRAIEPDDERLTGDHASGADGRIVRLGQRRPGSRAATYESIVAKYIAKGFHPLSAKAQADAWQMQHANRERWIAKRIAESK